MRERETISWAEASAATIVIPAQAGNQNPRKSWRLGPVFASQGPRTLLGHDVIGIRELNSNTISKHEVPSHYGTKMNSLAFSMARQN